MEVAVAIGTDPATTFSAIVPAPPDVEEYLISGFLRQKPLELVKAETVDLEVPANAEYILEGYVELGELRTEGPFGDHTGFYTMQDEYPVFHITCITHRKDQSTRLPSWASHPWKTPGWARPSNASSSRSCNSPCRRSSTLIFPPKASSTTS
ncbi:UbiD family decarboxylase domain-containing protein [Tunturiibacter gelidiferens]|uniref:UbiD family decarboxylase domain-containing protein n=1 Tax=Tunturiibacter gelidiferens TaxID=3069689 RepID=UPI003D9B198A